MNPLEPGRPTPEPDPFALLGLPRRFDLSDSQIEAAFLARLGGVHPDLAGDDSAADAAALTAARAALSDPERRAVTLLDLIAGPWPARDRSLPDGFLMEIMELREQIESDLAEAPDRARDRWTRFADERRRAHIDRVGGLFSEALSGDAPSEDTVARLRLELNAWRYTERLIEQLDPGYDPANERGLSGPG